MKRRFSLVCFAVSLMITGVFICSAQTIASALEAEELILPINVFVPAGETISVFPKVLPEEAQSSTRFKCEFDGGFIDTVSCTHKNNGAQLDFTAPADMAAEGDATFHVETDNGLSKTFDIMVIPTGSSCHHTLLYANGGIWADHTSSSQEFISIKSPVVDHGCFETFLELSDYTENLQKSGFILAGWNTRPDGSGQQFSPQTYMVYDELAARNISELYAQWLPMSNAPYALFDAQGGSFSEGETAAQNQYKIENGLLPVYAPKAYRPGYTLAGWIVDASARRSTFYRVGEEILVSPGENIFLYAEWVKNDSEESLVIFDANAPRSSISGWRSNRELDYQWSVYCSSHSDLERKGYLLTGWNTNPDGTGIHFSPSDRFEFKKTFPDSPVVTLYAEWAALELPESYYVFVSTETPFEDGSYCRIIDRSKPFVVPELQKDGYDFIGWTNSSHGDGIDYEHLFPGAAFPPEQNLYLYPIFHLSSDHSCWLILSPGEGTIVPYWHAASPSSQVSYFFHEYRESDNTPDLYLSHMRDMEQYSMRRPGYTFIGWNTKPDGSGTFYTPGTPITFTGVKTILYAQWEKADYTAVIRQGKLEITFDHPPAADNHYVLAAYTPFEGQMVNFSTPIYSGDKLIFDAPSPQLTPEIKLFTCDEYFAPIEESRLITISPSI